MLTRRAFATAAAAMVVGPIPAQHFARAQTIGKPARMLVGFTPGGAVDVVARLIASQLKDYAPSVVVENKPGAGGRLALDALKQAEPDGSVMVVTPGDQLALFPHVFKQLGYDALRDFAPVATVCSLQFVFVIGPLVPESVRSLGDFIAWARANPKLAAYGSPGIGTRPHFLGEMLARTASVSLTHVPYKGPATQDLLAGQLAAGITPLAIALSQVQAGKLRALATTAPKRAAVIPDVPTFREAGFASLEAIEHFGLLLPGKTPAPIVDSLVRATDQALASKEVKAGFESQGFETAFKPRSAYVELIKADLEMWRGAVQTTGFQPID